MDLNSARQERALLTDPSEYDGQTVVFIEATQIDADSSSRANGVWTPGATFSVRVRLRSKNSNSLVEPLSDYSRL
jgi:hypothetical protein